MAALKALDAIPEPLRPAVRQFSNLLQSIAGDHVRSLTLFGAVAAGTFDASRHSVQSVLVVDVIELTALRRLADHGVKLGKEHVSAPLIMTPKYIADSLDTFPLELIEIHQNHITLFGEDHFADLEFDNENVRLQCERELKVLAIGLRQGLLAAAGREKTLAEVTRGSTQKLVRTLRGMLWLRDRREAQPASAVVGEIENLLKRKLPGVRAAMDPHAEQAWAQFEALYHDVISVQETVDGW